MKIIKGDLFSVTEGIIAHGCNCEGAYAAGVAGLVRKKYPLAYERYKEVVDFEGFRLGQVQFVRVTPTLVIANCMTQVKPGADARYTAISESLDRVMSVAVRKKLTVSIPQIGCGIGGLQWETRPGGGVKWLLTEIASSFGYEEDSEKGFHVYVI